ncbi:MAG: hypothetical protein KOO66_09410 [Bacteroidales bacterium]|nr:hypothetical protein [Bacteroidales bacterium]
MIKINIKRIIPILVIIVAVQSCYYDNEELLYPELSSACDTLNITYSGTISPILTLQCLSCHSSSAASAYGGGIRLEDYSDVKIYVDNGKLWGSVSHSSGFSPMPKEAGKMAGCKITQFEIWINSGAANN